MLAAFHNVQGVDSGDTGVRLQIHGSEDPAVIGGLAELGGSAEANGGILLAGGTDSLGDRVGGGGEDRFVGVQTLQELITGVLAAVGQLQLFAVQGLISLGQTVRLLAYAEAGDPGAPGQVVQRILHHDLALPLGLGQLPDVGDGRTVGISLRVVEQLGQLNVQGRGGRSVAGVDVGEDVSGLIVVERLVGHILVPHGAVLVLDVDNVGYMLAGLVLTGDLLQQLVGGDVEGNAVNVGILFLKSSLHLGTSGGDGVQGHGAALFNGLLIQLLVGFLGVVDLRSFFPGGQLGFRRGSAGVGGVGGVAGRVGFLSAADQAQHHRASQQCRQELFALQHVLFLQIRFLFSRALPQWYKFTRSI